MKHSGSERRWSRRWFLVLLACVALSTSVFAAPHKVQVSDPALAEKIVARGGRLLADYGHFQLYEVSQISPDLPGKTGTEIRDEYNRIELNAGPINTTAPMVKTLRKTASAFPGKRLHLIQFVGPVQPAWHDELREAGVRVVTYIPHNAYLVYGDTKAMAQLQGWATTAPNVQWDGEYADDYKIHPHARLVDKKGNPRTIGTGVFAIQLVADAEANAATLQLIDQLKLEPIQRQYEALGYYNVQVRLAPESLQQLARQPDVISIQPYSEPRKLCERQDQIIAGNLTGNVPTGPGYLAWLESKGFTQAQFDASGFAVDISDSGIDNGMMSPNHFSLYAGGDVNSASRVIYNRLEGTPNRFSTIQGCDGHGNLNAHIVAGYDDFTGFPFADGSGFHYGLGVCPFVRVGGSVIFDPDYWTNPNYENLMSRAYHDGARISNNSWGSDTAGAYDSAAQAYDALVRDAQPAGSTYAAAGNQEMVIVFAVGNYSNSQTVESPGTAKNVITVGAAENVQAFGGTDGSGVDDSGADNANDIVDFSIRGPCADGRIKPDIMAPGTHVSGGAPQEANPGTNGMALACFLLNGDGVSGGVGGNLFYPSGQQFYTASSGTSHSTPCVAGGCALLRQYFINNGWGPPSPAMTKAYLMNSARYMTGAYANDTLPSNNQGMGEMDLGMAFDGTARILRDEAPADLFTASGQTRTFTGTIADSGNPFHVTLAWTDAPGNTSGSAYNNDLDLTVMVGGNTYKGNVFSGAYSVTGGSADFKNNVESVFLPAGVSGSFVVTVTAADINSDGVPNNAHPLDQDFAIVIYNAGANLTPVVVADSATLIIERCFPTNGVINPDETVTVDFALKNVGTANTTNLIATLQANDGVTSPSGPQTYGALVAGGAAVAKQFTFTASGTCGGTITNTFQLQDGSSNLGNISFNFSLGRAIPVTPMTQNFDTVTAPALLDGWTTSASGAQTVWGTSTAASDTAPNAAFSPDPSDIGVNELMSPNIAILSPAAQLTFKNSYQLEDGFDGGVLEIKIGSGSFTDILSAGGSFVSGGYNGPISTSWDNPLGGRQAWTGDSGGFITTLVNLPAAAAGQNIQLKWRCGTDNGTSGSGWYIDTISITDNNYACCTGSPPADLTITKMQVSWGLAKTNSDSCTLTATLDPGAGFSVTNKVVTLNIGGAQAAFTLNAKGRGVSGLGSCTLAYNKKTKQWTLSAKLRKGSWQTTWAAYGLENKTVPKPGEWVTMPVVVLIGDEAFADERPILYTAKANKSGSAK